MYYPFQYVTVKTLTEASKMDKNYNSKHCPKFGKNHQYKGKFDQDQPILSDEIKNKLRKIPKLYPAVYGKVTFSEKEQKLPVIGPLKNKRGDLFYGQFEDGTEHGWGILMRKDGKYLRIAEYYKGRKIGFNKEFFADGDIGDEDNKQIAGLKLENGKTCY